MTEAATNLSGVWHGRYFYPIAQPPVPFIATLTDADGWLTGVIEETGTAGDASGLAISASLNAPIEPQRYGVFRM